MGGGTYLAQFRRHKRKEVEGGSWEGWCLRRPAKGATVGPKTQQEARAPFLPLRFKSHPAPSAADIHADWLS